MRQRQHSMPRRRCRRNFDAYAAQMNDLMLQVIQTHRGVSQQRHHYAQVPFHYRDDTDLIRQKFLPHYDAPGRKTPEQQQQTLEEAVRLSIARTVMS